jgi:hypothetical protein
VQCKTTVAALIAYNNITNPNLIKPGQVILIPPSAGAAPPAPAPAPAAPAGTTTPPPPTSPPAAGGLVNVSFSPIRYTNNGRVAELSITVGNLNVLPAVASGRYYVERNADGGVRYVTLLTAIHDVIPHPQISNENLWKATFRTDDGLVFPAFAGCIYRENVYARGYEPTGPNTGFHWEQTLTGGWFDCGNEYRVLPDDIVPNTQATIPLTIYLVHPRQWDSIEREDRQVVHIDLEIFDSLGRSLGTVASVDFP